MGPCSLHLYVIFKNSRCLVFHPFWFACNYDCLWCLHHLFISLPERHHFIFNVMQPSKFITPSFIPYTSKFVPIYHQCNWMLTCVYNPRCVLPMRTVTVYWTLGWVGLLTCPQVVMVPPTWSCFIILVSNQMMKLGGRDGRWMPAQGLSHNRDKNVQIHYLVVKKSWCMLWQLVMSTCLAGLCFLPLWIVCLACRYFRLPVNWVFTHHSFISFNILVNTLRPSPLFTCYTCLCFVVRAVNKLRLQYEGALKYLGESVTGTKFRLRERQRGLDASIVTGDSGIDTGRCADELQCFLCTCTVVFPLEDQNRQ